CTSAVSNSTAAAPARVYPAGNVGTVCRAAVNECDLAETCTGSSTSCPPDLVKAAGTACTDDGNACTTDMCNGTVGAPACTHPAGNAGTVCPAAVNDCALADSDATSSPCRPAALLKGAGC